MEKRLLLVFALTFVVVLLFQPVLKKYFSASQRRSTQQAQQAPATTGTSQAPGNAPGTSTTPAPHVAAIPQGTKQAASESETVIENDLYKIRFTNKGGQVTSWILKKYTDDKGGPLGTGEYGGRSTIRLSPFALDIRRDSSQQIEFRSLRQFEARLAFGAGGNHVRIFRWGDRGNQDVQVRPHVRGQSETSVTSKGANVSALPMWPSGFGDEVTVASYASAWVEYQYNNSVERLPIKKISGGNTIVEPHALGRHRGSIFRRRLHSQPPQDASLVTLRYGLEVPKDPQQPDKEKTKVEVLGAAVGNLRGPTVERMYVGPKSLPVLESVNIPA